MKLKVNLPSKIHLDLHDVVQVSAESPGGSFTLKPRHIDMAAALSPSILSWVDGGRQEHFLAVSEGIIVKQGEEVLVSVRQAVSGELGELRGKVRELGRQQEEREQIARNAAARMEVGFIRRFLEFGHHG